MRANVHRQTAHAIGPIVAILIGATFAQQASAQSQRAEDVFQASQIRRSLFVVVDRNAQSTKQETRGTGCTTKDNNDELHPVSSCPSPDEGSRLVRVALTSNGRGGVNPYESGRNDATVI